MEVSLSSSALFLFENGQSPDYLWGLFLEMAMWINDKNWISPISLVDVPQNHSALGGRENISSFCWGSNCNVQAHSESHLQMRSVFLCVY
jgi:hypothetical protein